MVLRRECGSRFLGSIPNFPNMNTKILAAAGLFAGVVGLLAPLLGAALALSVSSGTMLLANVVVLLRKDRK